MSVVKELSQEFNIDELEKQLHAVIAAKNPVGYMENNINWEIDNNLVDDKQMTQLTKMMSIEFSSDANFEVENIFNRFLSWLSKNKTSKKIKGILCSIANEIKEMIDEEAELKKILTIALTAVVAAIGIGAVNSLVLTLLVGLLATMILKGVSSVCPV